MDHHSKEALNLIKQIKLNFQKVDRVPSKKLENSERSDKFGSNVDKNKKGAHKKYASIKFESPLKK
jgi:hypothetical protein